MLEQESDGIMPPLRSNDESIQRRKKHLEANQKLIQGSDRILTPLRSDGTRVGDHKKKYETQINAIGAGLYLSRSVFPMMSSVVLCCCPMRSYIYLSFGVIADKHGATDQHGAPITSAPDINEHLDGMNGLIFMLVVYTAKYLFHFFFPFHAKYPFVQQAATMSHPPLALQ